MKNSRHCVQIVTGTDQGCVRSNNEDFVGHDEQVGLAVLADGMGGHKAGEVASAMAVGTILNELSAALRQPESEAAETMFGECVTDGMLIQQAIEKANLAIHDTAARSPAYEGMGTTIVVAAFKGDRINVAHVGDSRLYRLRDGSLEQLTTDHSLSHELIAKGYFQNAEEVAAAGLKNAITRALGLETTVQVDLKEDAALPGDVYLLCSDGLTDMVSDVQIRSILINHGAHLKAAVSELIEVAKQKGGKDNISVILVRPLAVGARWAITTWPGAWLRWFGNFFATDK